MHNAMTCDNKHRATVEITPEGVILALRPLLEGKERRYMVDPQMGAYLRDAFTGAFPPAVETLPEEPPAEGAPA
jgi:hypothetical protein